MNNFTLVQIEIKASVIGTLGPLHSGHVDLALNDGIYDVNPSWLPYKHSRVVLTTVMRQC
jgi:hypothetical protein